LFVDARIFRDDDAMEIERGERIVPPHSTGKKRFSTGAAVAVAGALAVALVTFPDLRDFLRREAYSAASAVGAPTPADEYAPVYARLELEPLRAGLVASPKVAGPLAKLLREPCDKRAVAALADSLILEGEERVAARAYRGFSAACPDTAIEKGRAGELFLRIGETHAALAIADALISEQPIFADFHYLRARALFAAKRYDAAIGEYKTTIELFHDRARVHERLFVELANAYVAVGKPCEAAFTLFSWIALDPTRRSTQGARKRVEEYGALGCRNLPAFDDEPKRL
jgi:tetratricopeptide (TPR) repeat protein